ncbi:MAG: ABC transporter permease [Holosporaceae bacterium]|jgi:phospholipid/cholesterol/gamma-HCH transport system permease protein|nr:ABC transporter permease [Holosporaceae bacterium]
MCEPLATLGKYTLAFLNEIGRVSLFTANGVKNCFIPPFYFKEIFHQLMVVGFYSLPIVGLTAVFAGMVLALQTYVGFTRFSAEGAVASVVVISITRELGPVFAGLMVAGRVSSSIAAEIGSMRVSEQIDALLTLRVNPFKFLVVPRIIAGSFMVPFLVLIADIIGVMGGFLVSTTLLDFSVGSYIAQTVQNMETIDVISGLIKASTFGFVVAIFGCYHGFYSDLGARGVGNATTSAVVSSCIGILVLNYFLTALFFGT